jgi:hypothetical protein
MSIAIFQAIMDLKTNIKPENLMDARGNMTSQAEICNVEKTVGTSDPVGTEEKKPIDPTVSCVTAHTEEGFNVETLAGFDDVAVKRDMYETGKDAHTSFSIDATDRSGHSLKARSPVFTVASVSKVPAKDYTELYRGSCTLAREDVPGSVRKTCVSHNVC